MCRYISSHPLFSIRCKLSHLFAVNLELGVTTYAPLKRFGAGPGKRVGVVGIGGLGHLGLQWAAAMGADVVAISHSPNKKEEAKRLGSKEFLVFSDKEQVKAYKASLDLM